MHTKTMGKINKFFDIFRLNFIAVSQQIDRKLVILYKFGKKKPLRLRINNDNTEFKH